MTTLASPARAGAAARDASLAYWSGRAIVCAAVVAIVATALPDFPALALARWAGAAILAGDVAHAGTGWLGALCLAVLAAGGTAAAIVAASLGALVAFGLTDVRARRYGGRAFALGAVALAAACSFDSLRAGGGTPSLAFAAALALVLEHRGRLAPLLAFAVAAVWCDVAGDGIIAPAIAAAFAFGASFDGSDPQVRRRAWYAVAACALATCCTPALWAFPAHALEALRVDRGLGGIVATHPIDVAPTAYRIGFTLVVVAFLAVGSGTRVRAGDAALVALATLFALGNGAGLGIFGVLVAPILARSANETFGDGATRRVAWRPADTVVAGAGAVVALVLALVASPRADEALPAQPYALARFAPAAGTPHRFFCANVDWCAYAVATGPRGTTALFDGRFDASPAPALAAQRTVARTAAGWRGTLDRERVDVALVRRDRALATLLALRGDWQRVASDDAAELFVRVAPRR